MPKVAVVTKEGKKVKDEELSSAVFDVEMNENIVHKVVRAQLANKRAPIAHTKTRSERRGGGAKPWKQKGTGRARAGSRRSPIWRKGGITFGPRNDRNFTVKINKKERQKALFMTLTDKVKNENLIVLDELALTDVKTKPIAEMLKKLELDGKKVLMIHSNDDKLKKSARNLENVSTISADSVNPYSVLKAEYCIGSLDAYKQIEDHFIAKK